MNPLRSSNSVKSAYDSSPISFENEKKDDLSKREVIKKHLTSFLDAVKRWGITITGFLPFSQRWIVLNILLTPLRLLTNRSSIKKIKEKVIGNPHKLNHGITDSFVDLESPKHAALRQEVLFKNFHYSAHMYASFGQIEGGENGELLAGPLTNLYGVPSNHVQALDLIIYSFTNELGFKVDPFGNFYNLNTGTIFNLVYDKHSEEVMVCFMGLSSEHFIKITDAERKKMTSESLKAAAADFLGGIPPSSRQAMDIGRILKEIASTVDMKPVMVGHSHGGGLAQTGAVANGIKGVIFNSRPMGAGTRRYIGQSTITKNAKYITAFSGKKDWLSGNKAINFLLANFEKITGIIVPRTVGKLYQVPIIPNEPIDMQHSGFYQQLQLLKDLFD